MKKIEADPKAKFHMDEALTAVADEDAEHMGLYNQNEAARVAVEREHRVAGVKPKENGAGQPALAVKANGNGANGHAHAEADRDKDRHAETASPSA